MLVAVELVAAVRAIRLRELTVPDAVGGGVVGSATALPAEMDDRDLTEDVRLAERMLDEIAAFGTDPGHDGAARH